ncbi:MAG: class I SAM-dependent methyltransferase [Candidatus Bathyarchaeota archaeon]|nr:class I SAM-dependent methyltransferase [Candidatus Bathyarchaeota archaeon]
MGSTYPILECSGASVIANRLRPISGGRALDVATGSGGFVKTLLKTLKDYDSFVGIDSSSEEIEAAEKGLIEDAEFTVMNAESLEFGDGCFDTVCVANSLHHFEDLDRALSEMKRVLKPGGCFIVQEMFCDGEQTEAQRSEILSHNLEAEIDLVLGVHHNRTFTRKKIREIVRRLSLRNLEVFESSREVKCLFCDEREKCEDPKNEDIVKFELDKVEKNIERLKDHEEFSKFREEAEEIKERIRNWGSATASMLFFIGRK